MGKKEIKEIKAYKVDDKIFEPRGLAELYVAECEYLERITEFVENEAIPYAMDEAYLINFLFEHRHKIKEILELIDNE